MVEDYYDFPYRLGRIEDRAARFGERKLYRICWQTIFVSEIRQAVDTVRICLVSRTFLTPTGAASHARAVSLARKRLHHPFDRHHLLTGRTTTEFSRVS
jgi:hypothetical protein